MTNTNRAADAAVRELLCDKHGARYHRGRSGIDFYRLRPAPEMYPGLVLTVEVHLVGSVTTFIVMNRDEAMPTPDGAAEWLTANVHPFMEPWLQHTRRGSPVPSGGWTDAMFVLTSDAVDLLALWIPKEFGWAEEEARKLTALVESDQAGENAEAVA
ncbi:MULTISPECIES: hypothetical protein [Rhodococcus]|uniref:Uncharacterized protein n=1 Tax=Rhodococcus oxybenzonivorans TaxID=1990687 RepID=A0AAE4UUS5_9NOCA|nr:MULTISPECIES: hypothetical protein [Rhodococcus]MDV7245507.1 hypothetical protein [Rhodococcus oxybenzonivorans]MDV7263308.1 hypothetical protein [Rhodococcus oxybenzonivorans]MDV7276587.1 hypothetical protein [Rhodococcus oxybenzonivorans]MDV7336486.1 hypothetical protein [Rhodococcus oxybenzonivorans]MDV7346817.1 hypothetical protein [Rhodococcus oxybenzonivorans]